MDFGGADQLPSLPIETRPAAPRRGSLRPLLPSLLILAILGLLAWAFVPRMNPATTAFVFQVCLAVFMASLPPMICVVQNVTKQRQTARLANLQDLAVANTISYKTALKTTAVVEDTWIGSSFRLPLTVFFLTVLFGAIAFLLGYNNPDYFGQSELLLIGLYHGADVLAYQRETFVVIGIAFFASYTYALGMLLTRINTNDLYPISLHYYSARMIMASVAAAVLRQVFEAFDGSASHATLILAAFAVGFAPDLFVMMAIRKGFQILKIWGVRDDPDSAPRPTSMPLLMIDDLTRDKIDHLNDIGIDSVQTLARQNPLLMLTRLPYELALMVDWIAQAQLYVIVRETGMALLRAEYIRDIFDLRISLETDGAAAVIAKVLNINVAEAASLAVRIDAEPTYLRLKQVREAMADITV